GRRGPAAAAADHRAGAPARTCPDAPRTGGTRARAARARAARARAGGRGPSPGGRRALSVLVVTPRARGGLAAHVDQELEALAADGIAGHEAAVQIQD